MQPSSKRGNGKVKEKNSVLIQYVKMYISNELKVNKISFSISKNLKILNFSQVNINSNNVNLMTITIHNEQICHAFLPD